MTCATTVARTLGVVSLSVVALVPVSVSAVAVSRTRPARASAHRARYGSHVPVSGLRGIRSASPSIASLTAVPVSMDRFTWTVCASITWVTETDEVGSSVAKFASVAGMVAMANAEILSGIAILQTLAPGTPTMHISYAATIDLSSGGINTAAFSRDTGGAGLGARGTTQVVSTLGGNGSGLAAAGEAGTGPGGKPSRSREEIEMVFDQNKGAIYALYSRALRKDPTLQGKLVLKLTIEPTGTVSACEVVSSELPDDELLQKLIARVRMFRFQDKDVATVTTTKPIDFFPA